MLSPNSTCIEQNIIPLWINTSAYFTTVRFSFTSIKCGFSAFSIIQDICVCEWVCIWPIGRFLLHMQIAYQLFFSSYREGFDSSNSMNPVKKIKNWPCYSIQNLWPRILTQSVTRQVDKFRNLLYWPSSVHSYSQGASLQSSLMLFKKKPV